MALSGCALGAARYYEVGKFLAIFMLWTSSLLAPNGAFSTFGAVANVACVLFVLLQSCTVLDAACTWHERWYEHARGANKGRHEAAIVASAAAFLAGALLVAALLWLAFPGGPAHYVIVASEVLSLALLVVSITDWCQHGTLLTSSIMALYSTWLVHEALTGVCPTVAWTGHGLVLPLWLGLVLCAATVLMFAQGIGIDTGDRESLQIAPQEPLLPEAGDIAIGTSGMSPNDTRSFTTHCLVHMLVPIYIAFVLAKQRSKECWGALIVHFAAVFASQLLYGWHLVAPKVLRGRSF